MKTSLQTIICPPLYIFAQIPPWLKPPKEQGMTEVMFEYSKTAKNDFTLLISPINTRNITHTKSSSSHNVEFVQDKSCDDKGDVRTSRGENRTRI